MDMERWDEDDGIFMDVEMPMPIKDGEWKSLEEVFQMKVNQEQMGRYPKIMVIPIIPGTTRPDEKNCKNCDDRGYGKGKSFVRFFNANAFVGPVDIYINGRLMAENLPFKRFTAYQRINEGFYHVAVYSAGQRRNPLQVEQVRVQNGQIYTMAVIGTNQDVALKVVQDTKRQLDPTQSYVRFIQFSLNAPTMDVLVDGRMVIRYLNDQEISRYLRVLPGKHNIMLKESGSNRVLLEEPNMLLRPGRIYSAYIVSNVNERKGLQIVLSMEGASYLHF